MKKMNLKSTVLMSVAGLLMSTSAFADCQLDYSKDSSVRLNQIKSVKNFENSINLDKLSSLIIPLQKEVISEIQGIDSNIKAATKDEIICIAKQAHLKTEMIKSENKQGIIIELFGFQMTPSYTGAAWKAGVSIGASYGIFYNYNDQTVTDLFVTKTGLAGSHKVLGAGKDEAMGLKYHAKSLSGYVVLSNPMAENGGSV